MAVLQTSGVSNLSFSAIDLLTAALRLCQVVGDDETPTGSQLQSGMQAFNLMVTTMQASGTRVWLQEDVTLFLQPGQILYDLGSASSDHWALTADIAQTVTTATAAAAATQISVAATTGMAVGNVIGIVLVSGRIWWATITSIVSLVVHFTAAIPAGGSVASGAIVWNYATGAARPLKVSGARRLTYTTQAEVPLIPMSRLDYANVSNKVQTGVLSQYFFDPQTGSNVYSGLTALMSIFPSPTDSSFGMRFTARRPVQQFSTLANIPDFPAEWLAALKWTLALELAPEYGVPPDQMTIIEKQAVTKLAMLGAWDDEVQGTTTHPFSQGVYKLIARSLRLCNATGPQDVPTLGMINNAFDSLNAMVQEWQATGIHLWCEEEAILFPAANQVLYYLGSSSTDHATLWDTLHQSVLSVNAAAAAGSVTLSSVTGIASGDNIGITLDTGALFWTTINGAPSGNVVTLTTVLPSAAAANNPVAIYTTALIRPLRVYGSRRYLMRGANIETPIIMMARLDYQALTNKYTTGVVTQAFFDPQLTLAQMNLWPMPADSAYAIRFTAQRPLTTFADLTSTADFPDEWLNALAYNLAVDMWPEYNHDTGGGKDGGARIQAMGQTFSAIKLQAAQKLQTAMSWDREPESVLFGAAMMPGYRR